jgi:hypothetical protein
MAASESVPEDHPTDLLDLIGLGLASVCLEIEDLLDARPREYMVVASDSLVKPKV